MSLKRKVDLTPIWDKAPLKRRVKTNVVVIKPAISYKKSFSMYKRLVWRLTELNSCHIIDIDKRSFRQYDIDHKISIYYGFKNNILPWCIAHISNLRMLDNKSNLIKSTNVFIDDDNKWIID